MGTMTWKGYKSIAFNYGHAITRKLIKEKFSLPEEAVIHHIDGNTWNMENSNLVICENDSYHKVLHLREKALKECGNANLYKCVYCKKYDKKENMIYNSRPITLSFAHKECKINYKRARVKLNVVTEGGSE